MSKWSLGGFSLCATITGLAFVYVYYMDRHFGDSIDALAFVFLAVGAICFFFCRLKRIPVYAKGIDWLMLCLWLLVLLGMASLFLSLKDRVMDERLFIIGMSCWVNFPVPVFIEYLKQRGKEAKRKNTSAEKVIVEETSDESPRQEFGKAPDSNDNSIKEITKPKAEGNVTAQALAAEEERKRQQMEEERHQRLWNRMQEQKKPDRSKLFTPWKKNMPLDEEQEAALERDCAMSLYDILIDAYYYGFGADLDGLDDYTDVKWLLLYPDSDLKKTIWLFDRYHKTCKANDGILRKTKFLILSAAEQFDALGEDTENLMKLCLENDLHIVQDKGNCVYYDYVSRNTYAVCVEDTYPGSADDAATYGVLGLRIVKEISNI